MKSKNQQKVERQMSLRKWIKESGGEGKKKYEDRQKGDWGEGEERMCACVGCVCSPDCRYVAEVMKYASLKACE